MRTLSEYYVKVLLPYECHFSHTNFRECMSHYEMSHRSGNDTTAGAPPNENAMGAQPDRTKSLDTLLDTGRENLLFPEDSQGSLDGFSNQPLPDISVQEAESVLGISSTSAGPGPTTPSPSFPPGWSSPGRGGSAPDHSIPEQSLGPYTPPNYPNYYGAPPITDYTNYQRRNMVQYMPRGYSSYVPSPPLDESSYGYPNMVVSPNAMHHDYGQSQPSMVGGDWSWSHPQSQQRPRLPPPLPPHLQSQSMMFAAPPISSSPRPPTPQQQQQPMDTSNSSLPLDPIKIMVSDQGGPPNLDKSNFLHKSVDSDPKLEMNKNMFTQQVSYHFHSLFNQSNVFSGASSQEDK